MLFFTVAIVLLVECSGRGLKSPIDIAQSKLRIAATSTLPAILVALTQAMSVRADEQLLIDKPNRFSLMIPDGYTIVKRNVPLVTMRYVPLGY
jgi:hypothetical protein